MKKLYFLLLFLGFWALPALAASPSRIGTDSYNYFIRSGSGSSDTIAQTVPSTGQNRTLVMVVQVEENQSTISATYNGTTMTKIVNLGAAEKFSGIAFALHNPSTGTNNVVITHDYSGGDRDAFVIFTLQDTVQTEASLVDITGQNDTAAGTSDNQTIVTTANGDYLLSWNDPSSAGADNTVSDNASQTRIDQHSYGAGAGGRLVFTISEFAQTSAGSKNMGYSWTQSSRDDVYVISLKYLAPPSTSSAPLQQVIMFE